MRLGFIGCGNMAEALLSGMLKKQIIPAEAMIGSDPREPRIREIKDTYGIQVTIDNREVAGQSGILILSVKPQYYEKVIGQIKDVVSEGTIIVTIAPGKTLKWLEQQFGKPVKLVRCMPNTPALVGEGITAVCSNTWITQEELDHVCHILSGCGIVEVLNEQLMDVVVAVSSSSPAYVFMFIEAMADAAVADGMPREQAYKFASQAILGSAKMVLETGRHPGELKDMVCSPGGTTIEAVRVLEEKGFRSSVIEAMKACVRKAKGM